MFKGRLYLALRCLVVVSAENTRVCQFGHISTLIIVQLIYRVKLKLLKIKSVLLLPLMFS